MKKSAKLVSLFLVLCLLLSIGLTGCGSGNGVSQKDGKSTTTATAENKTNGKKIDITMWVFQDWTVGKAGELFNKWAKDFVAKNSDTVNKITFIGKDSESLQTSLMAGVALPDVFTGELSNGKAIADGVKYINIKPYFDAEPNEFKSMFTPSFLKVFSNGDKMYGLPYTGYVHLLFRNLTVLKKAGINPADGIKDWDDWLAQMKKVKESGAFAISTWGGDWRASGALVGANPDLKLGVADNKTTLTAEGFIPAFEYLLKVKPYAGSMVGTDDSALEAFKTNKIAFLVNGPWISENLKGVEYDAIPAPQMKAGGRTGGFKGGEWICGISGKNDEIIYKWMKYIVDQQQSLEFARDNGRIVLNDKVMAEPDVSKNFIAKSSLDAFKGGIDSGIFFVDTQMWCSPIASVTDTVWNGKATPAEGAKMMIDKINEMYAAGK